MLPLPRARLTASRQSKVETFEALDSVRAVDGFRGVTLRDILDDLAAERR